MALIYVLSCLHSRRAYSRVKLYRKHRSTDYSAPLAPVLDVGLDTTSWPRPSLLASKRSRLRKSQFFLIIACTNGHKV